MEDAEGRRTVSVRIRVAPEMSERLQVVSARYGMAPSTFCAFAVGRAVQQEEDNIRLSRMAIMDLIRRQGETVAGVLSDEAIERMLAGAAAALFKEHGTRKAVPRDGEASGLAA